MTSAALNIAFAAAYNHNKWSAGVMLWQYSLDINGTILNATISGLMTALTLNINKIVLT
jgi:hypothetical protein